MRAFLMCIGFCLPFSFAFAQSTSTASQQLALVFRPVIEMKFSAGNSSEGAAVALNFNTVNDLQQGVISDVQQLSVQSNREFQISVQTNTSSFEGPEQNESRQIPVVNTLFMNITSNNTGGTVAPSFFGGFHSLSDTPQDVVLGGTAGSEKMLAIAYKATPEFGYAAGTYSVGVVYTATQP